MKKISTFLIPIFAAIATIAFAQAPRTVLFEEFSSATCPPCATTNPIFRGFLAPYGKDVISVSFQCNIPVVGDPMYASNTSEVNTRMTYYGINSAPNCRMDGRVAAPNSSSPTHPLNVTSAILDARLAVTSPVEIHVNHEVILGTGGAKDSMEITISVKNVSGADFGNSNYVLQTCIVEDLIRFPKQAATNGETEFHTVMRKMIPSAAGNKFLDTLADGASKEIKYKVAVPTYIYSYKELGVVAFLQNNQASSKEILQAAISHPKTINGIYNDVAIDSYTLTGRSDDCDNTVGLEVKFTNVSTSADTIKTIDFIPMVAGANKTKSTWSGTLLPGESASHKIGNQTLVYGITSMNIFIDKLNGGTTKDLNVINNFKEQTALITFNPNIAGTELRQNFELPIGSGAPAKSLFVNEGVRIFKIDSTVFAYQGSNPPVGVGGFGNSRYSLLFYFMDGGVADKSSSIVFDKIDLTNSKQTKLKWSYAYTQRTLDSYDKMEVFVSKDCGTTWTPIYSIQGENMKTCDPDPSRFNYPGIYNAYPEDWKIEEVDLSAFDGTPEILLRFKGTGGNGQGYFMDDINLSSAVSTENPGILKNLSVNPNPASDYINIQISSEENAKASISLTDVNGKVVQNLFRELSAGSNLIKVNIDQTPGIYILEVRTEKGVRTEKLSIF
ncbi:MAG: T9SS type A sorting domain-containing protein [Saprospiraceae bacterium]|nr:T9SS type A sorting domain-containing protein [Saprospiraceae bacterium]